VCLSFPLLAADQVQVLTRGLCRCAAGDAAEVFWWQGRRTAVISDHNGLLLEQVQPSSCLPWCQGQAGSVKYGAFHPLS